MPPMFLPFRFPLSAPASLRSDGTPALPASARCFVFRLRETIKFSFKKAWFFQIKRSSLRRKTGFVFPAVLNARFPLLFASTVRIDGFGVWVWLQLALPALAQREQLLPRQRAAATATGRAAPLLLDGGKAALVGWLKRQSSHTWFY
jgi:hypothetical protein